MELKAQDLTCERGGRIVFRNVSLSLKPGQLMQLTGPNGSGKSSLLRALTGAQVLVEDKLFATLDTTTRRLRTPRERDVIITDTVGFIRDLPHHLVASFRATLEDAIHAHALLIVLDASDREAPQQLETVREVLDEVGANTQPRILVLNKTDRIASLPFDERQALLTLEEWREREPGSIAISAISGAGFDECFHSGYSGRTAIYEVMPIDSAVQEQIVRKATASEIKRSALERGLRTLRMDGVDKLLAGMTTPDEVLRVTQLDVT